MSRAADKLRGRGGFTLVELLVATALLALLTAAAAVGISTALSCRRDAIQISDAQTLGSTALTVIADELRFGREIAIAADNSVTLDSASYGGGVTVTLTDGRLTVGGNSVLPDATYANDLKLDSLGLNKNGGTITVTLSVGKNGTGTAVAGGSALWTGTVTVAPLNGIKTPG